MILKDSLRINAFNEQGKVDPVMRLEAWHLAVGNPNDISAREIEQLKADIKADKYHYQEN
jgi:hypothetical protein